MDGNKLKKMKIALIQQHATKNKQENIERGIAAFKEAANKGAQLVCYAELAFEPFFPQHLASGIQTHLAETIPGPQTEIFQKLAKEYGIVTVLNLFEKESEFTYDTSPVIDADGTLLGKTRMVHIPDYENFHERCYYSPGNLGTGVFDTAIGKVGIAICYDRHYPEYMRSLAVKGAELVIVPQAGAVGEWTDGLYEAEMQVASFQNGYFTALCNRVGKEEKLEFSGESFVCDPEGKLLSRAGSGSDEILLCDIDLSKVNDSHAKRLFLQDRRPELYTEWI
jgi:N-carbamoylputrescine amidase